MLDLSVWMVKRFGQERGDSIYIVLGKMICDRRYLETIIFDTIHSWSKLNTEKYFSRIK